MHFRICFQQTILECNLHSGLVIPECKNLHYVLNSRNDNPEYKITFWIRISGRFRKMQEAIMELQEAIAHVQTNKNSLSPV